MRIALVLEWNFSEPGGVQMHVRELARRLYKMGHKITVISKKRVKKDSTQEKFPVHYLSSPFTAIAFPPKYSQLGRLLKNGNFDIVHIHHIFTPISLETLYIAKRLGIPTVITNHTLPFKGNWEFLWRFSIPQRHLLPIADKIISVSKSADKFVSIFVKDKRVVIPNGVDVEFFKPSNKGLSGPSNILFVGRLVPRKGVHILLDAVGLLKKEEVSPQIEDLRLIIAGEGRSKDTLIHLAKSYGILNSTLFLSYIPNQELLKYYNSATIIAVPSITRESFGIVALEAMSCAKPVVVTDVGGLPEVIEDGETGIIVERENPYTLKDALKRLLINKSLRKRLGENARKKVQDTYSWKVVSKRICEVYSQVL